MAAVLGIQCDVATGFPLWNTFAAIVDPDANVLFRAWSASGVGLLWLASGATGCGGEAAPASPGPVAPKIAATTAPETGPSRTTPSSGWNCLGDPPDIAPGWRTEIAAVPSASGNPLEQAMRTAQDKLRAKICVNAEKDPAAGDACAFLASKIEPWKTGNNEREICASAVIKAAYIDEWRTLATDLDGFDKRLAASAKDLLVAATSAKAATAKPTSKSAPASTGTTRAPRIAVVAVYDDNSERKQNQLPGGLRADWLAARFRVAFAPLGGLALPPKGWVDGDSPPEGYDMVVVGHMFKRTTVSLPTVDVSWTGTTADGRQIETSSGTFPEAAAPPPPASTPPAIPATPGLHLTMDSDHAGSICAGETTQLWLKSSEQLHVRVFDLYGRDGAMLVFPPARTHSDVVPAGRTIPLGDPKGFEAVPAPGSEQERYVVIAAPTPAGLGRFASLNGYCRLSPDEGAKLHRGESIPPGAKVAVTGYRLLTGRSCPRAPSAEHLKAANAAIEQLPICPR